MIAACWGMVAWAGSAMVVLPDGDLRPGVASRAHVVGVDEAGATLLDVPVVTVDDVLVPVAAGPEPGVFEVVLTPGGAEQLSLTALFEQARVDVAWPVLPPPPSALGLPSRIEASASDGRIVARLTGADVPPVEALDVFLSDGKLESVERVGDAVEITANVGASAFPRAVLLGARDLRFDAQPAWAVVRLRSRTAIDLQTEPRARVELTVGKRSYGPFIADDSGAVHPVIDQFPGETVAQMALTDDLGNETRTSLALTSSASASLLALPSGPWVSGRSAPVIHLRGVHGDGHDWQGKAPVCTTSDARPLPVVTIRKGAWYAVLPSSLPMRDLRVRCALGTAAEATARIGLSPYLPATVALRVWPEQLSVDFPSAEVQVALVDAEGERMLARGVRVWADRGFVKPTDGDDVTVRGEYDGRRAASEGGDAIRARFERPIGNWAGVTVVDHLRIGHGTVAAGAPLAVYVRALDRWGRPLRGVEFGVHVGAERVSGRTGDDGWGEVAIPIDDVLGPVKIIADAAGRVAEALVPREAPAVGGPGAPDLLVERWLPISAGQMRRIDVEISPQLLYAGPRSVATIRATVRDAAGRPTGRAPDAVEVSSGSVGPWIDLSEGVFLAEYMPAPGELSHEVRIDVRAGGVVSQQVLRLEPRPMERSMGFGAGAIVNFGAVASPNVVVDLDWRTRAFKRQLLVRVGAGWFRALTDAETGLGAPVRVRTDFLPLSAFAIARADASGRSWWAGAGPVVAPFRTTSRIGNDSLPSVGVLPPGFGFVAGVARRTVWGEGFVEGRATALVSPGGAFAWSGGIGGFSLLAGYRVLY